MDGLETGNRIYFVDLCQSSIFLVTKISIKNGSGGLFGKPVEKAISEYMNNKFV
jgi:hypothetical protein